MPRFNLLAYCTVLVILGAISAHALEPLVVRVSDYPPSYFRDQDGNWTGVEVEVITAVLKEANLDFELKEIPWTRSILYIKEGKIDILMSLAKTEERLGFIDFVGVSKYEQMTLVVKAENLDVDVQSLEDLQRLSQKVGLQTGVYYPQLSEKLEADKEFGQHFEFVPTESLNIEKTLSGRISGFFEDRYYALFAIDHNESRKGLAVHSFSLQEPSPAYIGVSKKTASESRSQIKQAYARLEDRGTIQEIIDRWYR